MRVSVAESQGRGRDPGSPAEQGSASPLNAQGACPASGHPANAAGLRVPPEGAGVHPEWIDRSREGTAAQCLRRDVPTQRSRDGFRGRPLQTSLARVS